MSIGLTRTRNQIYNTSFLRSLYHGGKGWATRGGEVDVTLKPEHIVEELNRTPKLKRDLIMKMVEVMLDSEAFLEAYPRLYDPALAEVSSEYREKVREELAQIIVRLFRKKQSSHGRRIGRIVPGEKILLGNVCQPGQTERRARV